MGGMVLVDSSVWVEALREEASPTGTEMERLLRGPRLAATTGLVIQEVLQGVRLAAQIARVSTLLCGLLCLPVRRETHLRAAALYRKLRSLGFAVPTVDVLLAQVALENGASLWSMDAHFVRVAKASRLRLHRPARD
jgi:tRNA(fMet)-specific endonuclease VapC